MDAFFGQATSQQRVVSFTEAPGVETTVHTWPAKVLWEAMCEDLHDPIHIDSFTEHGFLGWGRGVDAYLELVF